MIARLKSLLRRWAFDLVISLMAERLKRDRAAVVALQHYRSGATLAEIIRAYAVNSENKRDDHALEAIDQIEDLVKVRSFRQLGHIYLGDIKIPDFDEDESNDVSIMEMVERVIDETLDVGTRQGQ